MHEVAAKQHSSALAHHHSLPSTPFPRPTSTGNPASSSHTSNARHFVGALNTRKIGTRLSVRLRKSQTGGFGIKIAERANSIGGSSPIHITAILATGSAYLDGRLKEGDLLLEINGQSLAGMTQFEVTRLLKSYTPNSVVEFVVSRPQAGGATQTAAAPVTSSNRQQATYMQLESQKNEFLYPSPKHSPTINSKLNNKCDNNQSLIDLDAPEYDDLSSFDDHKFEQKIDSIINKRNLDGPGTYHYDIPLNDTKSAGLGLYLKFPTVDRKDLGVWIEKVITGGAAWKDGRLLPDDQILAINGINIVGLSNARATETLKAGCRGFYPENDSKTIRLTIHRRDPSVIAKILQGVNNRTTDNSDLHTNGLSKKSSQALDKTLNNTVESYHTAFDVTTQCKSQSLNNTSGSSNGSGSQTSRTDSALSPRTQASNSFKLQGSHSDQTNDTSSATSPITDFTTLPDDSNLEENFKYSEKHAAYTLPKTLETYVNLSDNNVERSAGTKSCDEDSTDDRKPGRKRFQRDGFGRQSMSERTHAQLMARNSETFKKNQRVREERGRQKQLEDRMEKMRISESKSHSSFYNTTDRNKKIPNSHTASDMMLIYDQEMPLPNFKTDDLRSQPHIINGHRELPVDVPMYQGSSLSQRSSSVTTQSDYYHDLRNYQPNNNSVFNCQMDNLHQVRTDEACWRCRALNLRVYEVSNRSPFEQPSPFVTYGRRNNSFRAAINKSLENGQSGRGQ